MTRDTDAENSPGGEIFILDVFKKGLNSVVRILGHKILCLFICQSLFMTSA